MHNILTIPNSAFFCTKTSNITSGIQTTSLVGASVRSAPVITRIIMTLHFPHLLFFFQPSIFPFSHISSFYHPCNMVSYINHQCRFLVLIYYNHIQLIGHQLFVWESPTGSSLDFSLRFSDESSIQSWEDLSYILGRSVDNASYLVVCLSVCCCCFQSTTICWTFLGHNLHLHPA